MEVSILVRFTATVPDDVNPHELSIDITNHSVVRVIEYKDGKIVPVSVDGAIGWDTTDVEVDEWV